MNPARRARGLSLLIAFTLLAGCQSSPATGAPTASKAPPAGPESADAAGAAEGKKLFVVKGCVACHRAPGVPEAQGTIGPNLRGIGDRSKVTRFAGSIDNTHENMVRWLLNPPAMKPGTAMPNAGLTQEEAETLTAFLETLK